MNTTHATVPEPPQVSYHGVDPSPALTERIEQEAAKLHRYFDRITFCRVVIDRPHHHHHKGALYDIHIEIGVPRELIVVHHEPSERRILAEAGVKSGKRMAIRPSHSDPYVAVRDAFAAARRRLEDYARLLRSHSGA